MAEVPTNSTDDRALATASLERTRNAATNDQDGTLIHIGGGVYLTAGHVLYQFVSPDTVRFAEDYRIVAGDGLDNPVTTIIDSAGFGTSFHNFGWGTVGGPDMAVVFAGDAGLATQTLWAASDLNGLGGDLVTFGYPANAPFDGSTQVQIDGSLGANAYQTVTTTDGDATVLISQPGMQVVSGQSGSGVWLDAAGANADQQSFLTGIVTLDLTFNDGSKGTGFEPIAEIYVALAALLDARGYDPDDFARQYVTLSTAAGSIELDGTFFNEDIVGTAADDTISASGGDDLVTGGGGADTISDGTGIDTLYGGIGGPTSNADTFRMSADNRSDKIFDFQDGIDVIDITAWGAQGIGDLTLSDHGSGRVILRHGREAIVIDDGARGLRAADLDTADFIFTAGGTPDPVVGTDGRDLLYGTDAGEVLRDLGGVDRIYGRGGADTFEMALDGVADQIRDFEDGLDVIDIAAWGATGMADLTIAAHSAGRVRVLYQDEVLVLTGHDGDLLTTELDASDFIFA